MGMKFSFLRHLLLPALLVSMIACSDKNSTLVNAGTGLLYVAAQSNTTISAYTVNLASGSLTAIANSIGTGSLPSAIAITPSVNALFVANSGGNSISSYAINSDGSLTPASATTPTGTTPVALAIDAAGKFLFVANQASSSVSVFTISGSTLAAVAGSPFTTIPVGIVKYPDGTLPSGLAVSNSGKFLYVSNQLTNFVSAFSISSSGALAPLGNPFYVTGTGPTGLGIQPNGGFLYVTNSGADANDISAFAICDVIVTSCSNPDIADGSLTQITGSPFSAGLGPVAITFDPNFNFAYVVDKESDTISQYGYGPGSGVLLPLSPATISTGLNPVSIALRPGATGTDLGNTLTNPTDYVYVANIGAGTNTISIFTLNTTSGQLTVLGTSITTFAQTSAVAVK
jgi:6-phosphogluconolactonase (cycloisomerase 2 family)